MKVGALVMHTAKAIKRVDAPADRIFAVVGTATDPSGVMKGKHWFAWKHYLDPKNPERVIHAGLLESMAVDDPRLFEYDLEGHLPQPTAVFRMDSFYEAFNLEQMQSRTVAVKH